MEFRDLKAQYNALKQGIDASVLNVMKQGVFIGGAEVKALEDELSAYVDVKHTVTCANGTDALHLVLVAWGVGPGDAVFVPDFTFFATAEVVSLVGATPVFVDVDIRTFNMSPASLSSAIKHVKTETKLVPKVVIPVDLFGLPADYNAIEKIAQVENLLVLEDSAQGFGGAIMDRRACSFGHAATTSFFPAKPLGCYGDGGAIFTNDDVLANNLRSLKVHGKGMDKYDNVRIGFNSRLDTIQATILRHKLQAFAEYELDAVNLVAKRYTEALAEKYVTPHIPEGYLSSYAQYTLILADAKERQCVADALKEAGIPSMIYYAKPMHEQGAFAEIETAESDVATSTNLCQSVLSLPMHPYLTHEDQNRIIEVLLSI